MISERKKIEYWNFLTTEKNQPRPKGITVQRLALIKPAIIDLEDFWLSVIDGAEREAAEFYRSNEPAAAFSRREFWEEVRKHIHRRPPKTKSGDGSIDAGRHARRGRPE